MGSVDFGIETGDSVQKIGQLERALGQMEKRAETLTQALGKQYLETDKLEKAHKGLQSQLTTATSAVKQQTTALATAQATIVKLNTDVSKLTVSNKSLQIQLNSVTAAMQRQAVASKNVVASSANVHAAIRGVSGALGGLWMTYGNILPLMAGFAAAGTAAAAIKQGAAFSYAAKMTAVLDEEQGKAAMSAEKIKEGLLGMRGLRHTPVELAAGLQEFVKAGASATKAFKDMGEMSKFASLGEIDMKEATKLVVAQANAFGETYAEVANKIAYAAAYSATGIHEMGTAMAYTSPLGATLGFNLSEVAAALAVLANKGIESSKAGTALTTTFLRLANPTEGAKKAMEDLGVTFNAFHSDGTIKSMNEQMKELGEILASLDKPDKLKLMGALTDLRNIKGFSVLVSEIENLANGFEVMTGKVERSAEGTTFLQETMGKVSHETTALWEEMRATFQRDLITVANMDAVAGFLDIVLKARYGWEMLYAKVTGDVVLTKELDLASTEKRAATTEEKIKVLEARELELVKSLGTLNSVSPIADNFLAPQLEKDKKALEGVRQQLSVLNAELEKDRLGGMKDNLSAYAVASESANRATKAFAETLKGKEAIAYNKLITNIAQDGLQEMEREMAKVTEQYKLADKAQKEIAAKAVKAGAITPEQAKKGEQGLRENYELDLDKIKAKYGKQESIVEASNQKLKSLTEEMNTFIENSGAETLASQLEKIEREHNAREATIKAAVGSESEKATARLANDRSYEIKRQGVIEESQDKIMALEEKFLDQLATSGNSAYDRKLVKLEGAYAKENEWINKNVIDSAKAEELKLLNLEVYNKQKLDLLQDTNTKAVALEEQMKTYLAVTGNDKLAIELANLEKRKQKDLASAKAMVIEGEYTVERKEKLIDDITKAYDKLRQDIVDNAWKTEVEQLRATNSFKDGVKAALIEIGNSYNRMGDLAYAVVYDVRDALSDSMKAIFSSDSDLYADQISQIQTKIAELQYNSIEEGTYQMESLQTTYNAALRGAMAGNEEAFSQYMSNLDSYLAKAKETMSPNDYAVVYENTMDDLNDINQKFIDETENQWDKLGNIWNNLWDKIKDKALDTIADIIADKAMKDLGKLFSSSGSSSSGGLWDTVMSGISAVGSWFYREGGQLPAKMFAEGGRLEGGSGAKDDLYLGTINGVAQIAQGGEYIVNAKATEANLPLLEAINSQKYAAGGYVGTTTNIVTTLSDMVKEFIRSIGEMVNAVEQATDNLGGSVADKISNNLQVAADAAAEAARASQEAAAAFDARNDDSGDGAPRGYDGASVSLGGYTFQDIADGFRMLAPRDYVEASFATVTLGLKAGAITLGGAVAENASIAKNMRKTIDDMEATLSGLSDSFGEFGDLGTGLSNAAENALSDSESSLSSMAKAAEDAFGKIGDMFGGNDNSSSDSSSSGSGIGGVSGADLGKGGEDWAEGGWLGKNPRGGMINQGSGVKDDVFLGLTSNYGMGGEYVVNKKATAAYLPLLEAINSKGFDTGGLVGGDPGMNDFLGGIVPNIYNSLVETTASDIAAIVDPLTSLINFAFANLGVTVADAIEAPISIWDESGGAEPDYYVMEEIRKIKQVTAEQSEQLTATAGQLMAEIAQGYEEGAADLTSSISGFLDTIESITGGQFADSAATDLNEAFNIEYLAREIAEAQAQVLQGMSDEANSIYNTAAEAIGPTNAYRTTTDQGTVTPDAFTAISDFMTSVGDFLQESSLDDYQNSLLDVTKAYDKNIAALKTVGASQEDITMAEIARGVALEQVMNKAEEAKANDIASIMDPINEGLDNIGRSDVDITLRGITKEFDNYRDTLVELGASVEQLTRVEQARKIAISESLHAWQSGLQDTLISTATAYMNALQSELDTLEGNLDNAKSAYIAGLEREAGLLEDIANEKERDYQSGINLARTLAEAMGDEAAAAEILAKSRALELKSMDASLHPLQELVWGLEDAQESFKDFTQGIESIQNAIDGIMGDSQSVQSRDYMEEKYATLLKAAQDDPAKASEFASFSKTYLDFMSDYGDPKAREKVLKDLWSVEEDYTQAQLSEGEQTNINLVDMTAVMEDLYKLESASNIAREDFENNRFTAELENFTDTKSILTLETEYFAAKKLWDENTQAAEIKELEKIVGVGQTTADLLAAYLEAKNGEGVADIMVNIYDAFMGFIEDNPWGKAIEDWLAGGNDNNGGASTQTPEQFVTDLYASVGRGPVIGDAANQIDQEGWDYWLGLASSDSADYNRITAGFRGAVADYLTDNPRDDISDHVVDHISDTVDPNADLRSDPNQPTNTGGLTDNSNTDSLPTDWRYSEGMIGDKHKAAWDAVWYAYKNIGRSSSEDESGAMWWYNTIMSTDGLTESKFNEDFMDATRAYVRNNPTDPVSLKVIDHFGTADFNTGGSFTVHGPGGIDNLALPQLRVTQGEIVNVSRADIMAELVSEIRNLGNKGGDVQVKVFVGNKEIKDVTIETMRTDPRAQQVIRRAASV